MKKLSIMISLCLMLIYGVLNVNAQEIIKLKSGEEFKVKILQTKTDSVKFYNLNDSTKKVKVCSRSSIQSIEPIVNNFGEKVYSKEMETSGDYLRKASTNLTVGLVLPIIGTGIACIPLFVKMDSQGTKIAFIAGSAAAFIGIIEIFVGVSRIGKAGKLLNQEHRDKMISFGPTKEGLGISFNF